jgi:hypothetical protein
MGGQNIRKKQLIKIIEGDSRETLEEFKATRSEIEEIAREYPTRIKRMHGMDPEVCGPYNPNRNYREEVVSRILRNLPHQLMEAVKFSPEDYFVIDYRGFEEPGQEDYWGEKDLRYIEGSKQFPNKVTMPDKTVMSLYPNRMHMHAPGKDITVLLGPEDNQKTEDELQNHLDALSTYKTVHATCP